MYSVVVLCLGLSSSFGHSLQVCMFQVVSFETLIYDLVTLAFLMYGREL